MGHSDEDRQDCHRILSHHEDLTIDKSSSLSYHLVRTEGIKMGVTSLSVKGQVVIPKSLRDVLGLQPGDRFIVLQEGDAIVLKPMKGKVAARLYGKYQGLGLLSDLKQEHLQEVQQESQR